MTSDRWLQRTHQTRYHTDMPFCVDGVRRCLNVSNEQRAVEPSKYIYHASTSVSSHLLTSSDLWQIPFPRFQPRPGTVILPSQGLRLSTTVRHGWVQQLITLTRHTLSERTTLIASALTMPESINLAKPHREVRNRSLLVNGVLCPSPANRRIRHQCHTKNARASRASR